MYIYKLKFQTGVHFGSDSPHGKLSQSSITCHADTFFSAVCHEWLNAFGQDGLNELINTVIDDEFFISDLFPYYKEELYVPKPVLFIEKVKKDNDKIDKKYMKKIKYIPVKEFNNYIEFLKSGGDFPFEKIDFGEEYITKRVVLREDKPIPYIISAYRFKEDAGLYFILDTTDEIKEKFETVIESLGLTGIGGKRNSGLGKFELYEESYELGLYDCDIILKELLKINGDLYMLLSVLSPTVSDIESLDKDKSTYTLIQRTGFVESINYSDTPLKKKQTVLFNSGSCFDKKLCGQLLDVSNQGGHSVYRYGKGMYLGVSL